MAGLDDKKAWLKDKIKGGFGFLGLLFVNRIKHGPYSIPIRQVKTYEDPLQIDPPKGYEGPIDEAALRRITEQYFRGFVEGPSASIHYPKGGSNTNFETIPSVCFWTSISRPEILKKECK